MFLRQKDSLILPSQEKNEWRWSLQIENPMWTYFEDDARAVGSLLQKVEKERDFYKKLVAMNNETFENERN